MWWSNGSFFFGATYRRADDPLPPPPADLLLEVCEPTSWYFVSRCFYTHTPHKQEAALFHVPQSARIVSFFGEGAARVEGVHESFSPVETCLFLCFSYLLTWILKIITSITSNTPKCGSILVLNVTWAVHAHTDCHFVCQKVIHRQINAINDFLYSDVTCLRYQNSNSRIENSFIWDLLEE